MKFIKHNKVYWVSNDDLNINHNGGHNVLVTWVNPFRKICRVKTITSIERFMNGKNIIPSGTINLMKTGKLLPIPIDELNSSHYSGVYQESKVISTSKLRHSRDNMIYPKRYKKFIK